MSIENLNQVENYIKENKDKIMAKCSIILGKNINMANFNGIIGGKNTAYNIKKEDYSTASEYVKAWLNSFERLFQSEKDFERLPTFDIKARGERSVHRMNKLLSDPEVKKFIIAYLARTYLKNLSK